MKRFLPSKAGSLLAASLLLGAATPSHASLQMATEYGCINCHGEARRGESPSLARLSGKLSRLKGDSQAQAQFVAKYQAGKPWERVEAHERISPEIATALVHWLAEGGK